MSGTNNVINKARAVGGALGFGNTSSSKHSVAESDFSSIQNNVSILETAIDTIQSHITQYVNATKQLYKHGEQISQQFNSLYSNEPTHRLSALGQKYESIHSNVATSKCELLERLLRENVLTKIDAFKQDLNEIKKLVKQRTDARSKYDHYYSKLLALRDSKSKTEGRGKQFSAKDSDRLQRNELKFNDAKKQFVDTNKLVAKRLYEQWRTRFTVIDPLFNEVVKTETMFLSAVNNQFQGLLPELKLAMSKPLKVAQSVDVADEDDTVNSDADESADPNDVFNQPHTKSANKQKQQHRHKANTQNDVDELDIDTLSVSNDRASRRSTLNKKQSTIQPSKPAVRAKKAVVSSSSEESSDGSSEEDEASSTSVVPVKPVATTNNNAKTRRQTAPLFDDAFLTAPVQTYAGKQNMAASNTDLFDVFATSHTNNNHSNTNATFNAQFDAFNTVSPAAPSNGYTAQQSTPMYQQPQQYNQPQTHNRTQSAYGYNQNNFAPPSNAFSNQLPVNQSDPFATFASPVQQQHQSQYIPNAMYTSQPAANSYNAYNPPAPTQLALMPAGSPSMNADPQSPFDDLMAVIEKQNAQQLGVPTTTYNNTPSNTQFNNQYQQPPTHQRAPSYTNTGMAPQYTHTQPPMMSSTPSYASGSNQPSIPTGIDDPFAQASTQPMYQRTPSMSTDYQSPQSAQYQAPLQHNQFQASPFDTPQRNFSSNSTSTPPYNTGTAPVRAIHQFPAPIQPVPVTQPFDATQPFSSTSPHDQAPPISSRPVDKAVFESFNWD